MSDTVSRFERSRIMAAVKSKGTSPEMTVRRLVHSLGFRFRLHVQALPGTPDLVFPSRRKVINVSGCFWHGHTCGRCRIPATNRAYWVAKIDRNRSRDKRMNGRLRALGYSVLTLWECQLRNPKRVADRITRFLG